MSDLDNLRKLLVQQHEEDEQQLSVIFTEASKVIVEAPAGFGKTTTMISRIAFLFASGQIPNPKRVLGLTFSVNAALKVKREIAQKLPELMGAPNNPNLVRDKITITNYHGFCKGILKKYGYLLTDFLRRDINSIKAIAEIEVKDYPDISKQLSKEESGFLDLTSNIIQAGNLPDKEAIEQYNRIITQKMIPFNYITHNAIILMTISLFSSFQEIRKFYQSYYPLLIVDEFQDTNSIAWKLLEQLISPESQLLFLGDPLQRIYGFIGALPDVMSVAAKKYNMQLISLSKNYRFRLNQEMLKLDANIRANAKMCLKFQPEGRIARLPFFFGLTQEDEADLIVTKIKKLQDNDPDCKIAILFRGRNINSEVIENALSSRNISYFYGMFTDEDKDYVNFHIICHKMFVKYFEESRNLSSRSLGLFAENVKNNFATSSSKTTVCLLSLLDALIQKVLTDYATLSSEDKYSLILDIFKNRQLKQAMEYVNENVIISTIHGAKGLEWEYVFIPDVERWVFPSSFICKECPQRFNLFEDDKCQMVTQLEDHFQRKIIDELSVFYVGMTRAKKQVYISASANRYNSTGQKKSSVFSCFATLPGIQLVDALKFE